MQTTIKISEKLSYLDETLKKYGDISYLFHFMGLNPSFTNILGVIPANSTIQVDDYVITNPVPSQLVVPNPNPDVKLIAVANQSLFDLSTRFYGNINKVVQLMIDNPNIDNINQAIAGKSMLIKTPNNSQVAVKSYNRRNAILTTGIVYGTLGRSFNISYNFSFH